MTSQHIRPPSTLDTAALPGRAPNIAARDGRTEHEKLVRQTEKWVAQTFYGTLLKQMRDSPFHSDLMDGGNGGKMFASMLDQRLADHMSRHAGGKLVKSIVKKIEAGQAAKRYAQASKKTSAPTMHPDRTGRQGADSQTLRKVNVHMAKEHA